VAVLEEKSGLGYPPPPPSGFLILKGLLQESGQVFGFKEVKYESILVESNVSLYGSLVYRFLSC
jgi:hypothetical protein